MLLSVGIILILSLFTGFILNKIKLPSLIGYLIIGIVIGPFAFNLIDTSILNLSADIRKVALIIILLRAGLSLNISELKKVGRPAVLFCFLPATFEIIAMIIFAPKLLGISTLDAGIMGAVIGAVSPAVIVPRMLKLIEEGKGTKKSIPQLVLAGSSVDDVFVIVIFTSLTGFATSGQINTFSFLNIPISILLGVGIGLLVGFLLSILFNKVKIRTISKTLILLAVSFVLVVLENKISSVIPFSALLAIMAIGIVLQKRKKETTKELSNYFNKLWVVAEIFMFVLVGASLDLKNLATAGFNIVILLFISLIFRSIGVFVCLIKTSLNKKEKLFCIIAYLPKATVQAAIGAIPLSLGISSGNLILTIAILSIIITAPVGAIIIDLTSNKLLK